MMGCASSKKMVKEEHFLSKSTGKREIRVWASQEKPPEWLYRESESDEEYYYFTGISGNEKDEKSARYDAFRNGIDNLAKFIGVDVKIIYESLQRSCNLSSEITDYSIAFEEKEKQLTEAFCSGFKGQEWYIERYEVQLLDKTPIDTYWKAYLKAQIPKKEVMAASLRMKELKEKKWHKKGSRIIILISEKMLGKEKEESIVANELSKMLVENGFRVMDMQNIGKTNAERLKMALEKEMSFSLKEKYAKMADLVVYGNCSTRAGVDNPYMMSISADAYIKVLFLETGEIIAQTNAVGITAVGFTQEQAAINSLQKAAEIIGKDILKKIEE